MKFDEGRSVNDVKRASPRLKKNSDNALEFKTDKSSTLTN